MKLESSDFQCTVDTSQPTSLAIHLDFFGDQPNYFGVRNASARVIKQGGFVGRVANGRGCNLLELSLTPHCNGTHTETISHIVEDVVEIAQLVDHRLGMAVIVSIEPIGALNSNETYLPDFDPADRVVTAAALKKAMEPAIALGPTSFKPLSIIIRTLPNHDTKLSQKYDQNHLPAFLTCEATQWINDLGVKNLLIDLPSIDRMNDEGILSNHHLFWNVEVGTSRMTDRHAAEKTITEMIFVPEEIKDGIYFLNLQFAPFRLDAAPSQPIIYPVTFEQ